MKSSEVVEQAARDAIADLRRHLGQRKFDSLAGCGGESPLVGGRDGSIDDVDVDVLERRVRGDMLLEAARVMREAGVSPTAGKVWVMTAAEFERVHRERDPRALRTLRHAIVLADVPRWDGAGAVQVVAGYPYVLPIRDGANDAQ